MWVEFPQHTLRMNDRVQLTQDEVRHETARQMSIMTGCPTRVRGAKVEVLFGGTWAEIQDAAPLRA